MEHHKSSSSRALRARAMRFAIAALQGLLKTCAWAVPLPGMIPFDQEGCCDSVNCTCRLAVGRYATPTRNIAEFPDSPEQRLMADHHHGPRDAACGPAEPRARLSPAEERDWAALIRRFD